MPLTTKVIEGIYTIRVVVEFHGKPILCGWMPITLNPDPDAATWHGLN